LSLDITSIIARDIYICLSISLYCGVLSVYTGALRRIYCPFVLLSRSTCLSRKVSVLLFSAVRWAVARLNQINLFHQQEAGLRHSRVSSIVPLFTGGRGLRFHFLSPLGPVRYPLSRYTFHPRDRVRPCSWVRLDDCRVPEPFAMVASDLYTSSLVLLNCIWLPLGGGACAVD